MKIICPYCATPFNDTLEKCPSCGAPNTGVRRRSGAQPITIGELKDWYASKGLPPYETTRFFIGEDYREPRAFGIYKDENSGNFVVYKNKADGQRAVRYEGTDEAYAVNELYQRLKQEIIQQKRNGIKGKRDSGEKPGRAKKGCLRGCLFGLLMALAVPIIGGIVLFFIGAPKEGYYLYEQTLYCRYDHNEPTGYSDWFYYDGADGWHGPQRSESVPEPLRKDRYASDYYLAEELPAQRAEPSFFDSLCYQDIDDLYYMDTGYYRHGEETYYHLDSHTYNGWYYYDTGRGGWYESDYEDIPYELQHSGSSEDFYYTPTWDSSTQITDFTETEAYADYLLEQELSSSDWDDDDDDYSWDSGSSWDSGGTDWDSDW